ncbi:MAG: radical SAM protein [Paludibacteraceae bacterium]|nr:radical SAM protein [Paludibacteraceae bacterium]
MSTVLYDSVIFGPVKSRRLGVSLGVNLLPVNVKLCSFDCIYCECGLAQKGVTGKQPTRDEVRGALEDRLMRMHQNGDPLDVITFAGNGEPTLHHEFKQIIEDTIRLRNEYFPNVKISVLSNATMLHRQDVVEALKMVDNNILKLDSGIEETAHLIDSPHQPHYSVASTVEGMKQFHGDFIMQTMFLRGTVGDRVVDNTTDEEVSAWIEVVKQAAPKKVMIYSIDRETPIQTLEKVAKEEMQLIADRLRSLGFSVDVA